MLKNVRNRLRVQIEFFSFLKREEVSVTYSYLPKMQISVIKERKKYYERKEEICIFKRD